MPLTCKEQVDLISENYIKASAPPAQLWSWVRCLEEVKHPNEHLVAVRELYGKDFPILEFLRAKAILIPENKNAQKDARTAISGHSHAVLSPSLRHGGDSDDDLPLFLVPDNISVDIAHGGLTSLTPNDVHEVLQNGLAEFPYQQSWLRLYVFTYSLSYDEHRLYILAGKDLHAAKSLIAEVHVWASQLHDETWVYNGLQDGWRKDKNFFNSIAAAREEDLVLPEDILTQLYRDSTNFFQSQALFRGLGLVWKRGILLVGPPGNGKTGAIRLLAKRCAQQGIAALYVQSPTTCSGPEEGIAVIFKKARRQAPCLLILEDIDTLVSGDTRSVMLNELDGLETNDGILVIGTANDDSKLDAAITQRPSRFDAKYTFTLPDLELRRRFLKLWIKGKIGEDRWEFESDNDGDPSAGADGLIEELARSTQGWSFAFIKELFVSFALSQSHLVTDQTVLPSAVGSQQGIRFHAANLLAQRRILQRQLKLSNPEESPHEAARG